MAKRRQQEWDKHLEQASVQQERASAQQEDYDVLSDRQLSNWSGGMSSSIVIRRSSTDGRHSLTQ